MVTNLFVSAYRSAFDNFTAARSSDVFRFPVGTSFGFVVGIERPLVCIIWVFVGKQKNIFIAAYALAPSKSNVDINFSWRFVVYLIQATKLSILRWHYDNISGELLAFTNRKTRHLWKFSALMRFVIEGTVKSLALTTSENFSCLLSNAGSLSMFSNSDSLHYCVVDYEQLRADFTIYWCF